MNGVTPALVFYARNPPATRAFYETLGLAFVEERHGDGPVHFACDFQGIALEIYPKVGVLRPVQPVEGLALIFFTDAFDKTIVDLALLKHEPTSISTSAVNGLHTASFRDPDGRLVRLLERDGRDVQ